MPTTKYQRIVNERLTEKEKHRRAFKMMTSLFIGSSMILFGTIFFIWVANALPNVAIPFTFQVNTLVIIASSIFLYLGLKQLKRDELDKAGWLVKGALVTGVVFAVVQIVGWNDFLVNNTAYKNILLPITVLHFMHIVVGLCLLVNTNRKITDFQNHSRNLDYTLNISRFWHFLTCLWVGFMLVL